METLPIIIKQDSIQTIVQSAPQSYQDNKLSCDNCNRAGQAILDAIMQQGMTDELDQKAASFIEKARKTVKKMNERRSPVTKLFDDIRKEFTVLENAIDPTKADTIPYRLQAFRNQYAAKKRAEEEERRRKEYEVQQQTAQRNKLIEDIKEDLIKQFACTIKNSCDILTSYDDKITLQNFDKAAALIREFDITPPAMAYDDLRTMVSKPSWITAEEMLSLENSIKLAVREKLTDQYMFEVGSTRDYILDRLPSKKANLERMAKSSAEEAARFKAEMEERQRKEAEAQEQERKRKEEEERQKAELARQQAEMAGLFSQANMQQDSSVKVKVTKKIELLNPEGILPIISMWWSKEGCTLTTDDLTKLFKKQITFCEKLANKEEIFIENESVNYIDDVKAK